MTERILTESGVTVTYQRYGSGPPLVLVHGAFSDDVTNWEFVKPLWENRFTVYAMARRGRGGTDPTTGHGIGDEAWDVVALLREVGEPAALLGHSYGAHCSLAAAALAPELVKKLVLYEPPWPSIFPPAPMAVLARLAAAGAWDEFSTTFFRDTLFVPAAELEAVRTSELWPPIVADAKASWEDLQAVARYEFDVERFRFLPMPVLLQIGTESPRHLYVTDALASVLRDGQIGELAGQAHEGMTTAPEQYAEAVVQFLLG